MVQNLISSVDAVPSELISKMNISAPAVLVNQCDEDSDETIEFKGYRVLVLNRNERGVGRSRNLCIDNCSEDIILFSDEDIVYNDDYVQILENMFETHPEADMIFFNVEVCEERRTYWNDSFRKVSGMNCGRYPAYSIAARRDALIKSGVKYSVLFGGGAKYSNGEDSLFIRECLKSGMRLYASDKCIGREEARESTWFKGYTEKFFFDRGVLFYFLYGAFAYIWGIRFVLVKKDMFKGEIGRGKAFKLICDGIRCGRSEKHNKNIAV